MKAIEKAKEIAQAWRQLKGCEPNIIVEKTAYYKAEFVLFVIERINAEQFFDLHATLDLARKASEEAK